MQSAGVRFKEEDFSTYVESVSDAIIGLAGPARKGPTHVTLVTSKRHYIDTFGIPVEGDYAGIAALRALETTDKVWYKRVIHGGAKATAGSKGEDKLIFETIVKDSVANGMKIVITEGDSGNYNLQLKSEEVILESYEFTMESSSPDYVTKVINGTSPTFVVQVQSTGEVTTKTLTFSGGKQGGAHATAGNTSEHKLVFKSKYFDSTLNGGEIYISKLDSRTQTFDITLTVNGKVVEAITSVTLDPQDDRYVESFVNDYAKCLSVQVTDVEALPYGTRLTIDGGDDGAKGVDLTDLIGNGSDGLEAFSNPEVTDINILITPGWSDSELTQYCTALCESRGDCMYLVDTPYGLTPQQAVDWTNGTGIFSGYTPIDSSYVAVYWSWVQIYCEYAKKKLWVPPSCVVAPQFATSDKMSDPWIAPAGLNRGKLNNVLAVERPCTQGERDHLYGNRNIVNPIVNFRGSGITIWGQKTGQRKPSATDRINVRRLMNAIKRLVVLATQYYVFEPNDEFTWNQWVDMVEPRLDDIKQRRGLYDYEIKMDSTTITEDDITNYRMPGVIRIKPTRSAEFIPLTFSIMPSTVEFEE